MKPGSRDKNYSIRITGQELEELKKFTWQMAEAFGLDRRIERYQGQRAIGLYRWDLDCLEDVTSLALDDKDQYPDESGPAYEAMKRLHERIKSLRKAAYAEMGHG
jgi:endonuclease/exonuclease/phosphatase family metal-dependent hydrolase